jgi:hypothetical protein
MSTTNRCREQSRFSPSHSSLHPSYVCSLNPMLLSFAISDLLDCQISDCVVWDIIPGKLLGQPMN